MKTIAIVSVIYVVSLVAPIFVEVSTVGRLQIINNEQRANLADIISKLSFSLSGILMFVLGGALRSRQRYKNVEKLYWVSTLMCWCVAFLVFLCTVCALFSVSYLVTEDYIWILSSYLLLLVISTLLIFNALTFAVSSLTRMGV